MGKIPWRRKWHPTPVFLPGESHGQRDLVGCSQSTGPQSDTIKHAQQGPPRSTLPGGQLQWRDVQWLPSQTECSLPPASLCSSETDLGGVHSDQEGADPSPDRAVTTHRAMRRPQPISREGLDHNTNYIPYPGNKGQQTLRKDVVGIHSKNRLCTKSTRLTQATQGHSHVETVSDSLTDFLLPRV